METKTLWNSLNTALAAAGGWLGWYVGGWDGFIYALVVFVVIDYITGLMCAVVNKNLSSEIGAKGIFRKILIFALVGIGYTIDMYLIGDGSVIRTAVIFFFISNEGVSLLENATHIGLPVPPQMKAVLAQLHDNKNGNGGVE
jgi:toxin secretion/phage lysis holin